MIIGSRDASRAAEAASAIAARVPSARISGDESLAAVTACDVALLAVPFAAQLSTVKGIAPALQGKILIDVTVPLVPPKVSLVQLPAEGSCVVRVQRELGEGVRVVSAFQNVSAHKLSDPAYVIACDVLVCSDSKEARQAVIALAADAGLRGIDAGPLANSAAAEAMTSLLIWINRAYKVPDAGLAITGIP